MMPQIALPSLPHSCAITMGKMNGIVVAIAALFSGENTANRTALVGKAIKPLTKSWTEPDCRNGSENAAIGIAIATPNGTHMPMSLVNLSRLPPAMPANSRASNRTTRKKAGRTKKTSPRVAEDLWIILKINTRKTASPKATVAL